MTDYIIYTLKLQIPNACEKLLAKGHALNSHDQSVDCTVSGDGIWSKRGEI